MSDSLRPCWKCDYLLAADAGQSRCPECGHVNDFAEIDADALAALNRPVRTLICGRVLSGDLSRKLWHAKLLKPNRPTRLAIVATLAGFVVPVMALVVSATIGLRTTVHCLPHPVTQSKVPGQPTACRPYHRPQFLESNWYGWTGWNHSNNQDGEWAHLAFHPLGEQIDRKVMSRSIEWSPRWSYATYAIRDSILITFTIASWWGLAAAWSLFVKRRIQRTPLINAAPESFNTNRRFFCALVLASSGIILTIILAADLVIRLTVPDYGISGRGIEWYSLRAYLPWSIAIPALFLWRISSKGPPGMARGALLPALVIGSISTLLIRLIARLKGMLSGEFVGARRNRSMTCPAD